MRIVPLIVVVSVSSLASAQESPRPRPGKAHELLARDAGTWDCDVKMFFQGPAAPAAEFKGVEVNTLVSGDLYLQTSFRCRMGDHGDFEGHSLLGYDPRSKKYVGTWVDNFTAAPSQLTGEYDEQTKTLTVSSAVVDAAGNELDSKQVTTWLEDSKKRFEVFLVVDAGGKKTDIKLMEMTATKRRAATGGSSTGDR